MREASYKRAMKLRTSVQMRDCYDKKINIFIQWRTTSSEVMRRRRTQDAHSRAVNLSHCDNDDENPDELARGPTDGRNGRTDGLGPMFLSKLCKLNDNRSVSIRMNHMMLPCLQQQSVHIAVPNPPPSYR